MGNIDQSMLRTVENQQTEAMVARMGSLKKQCEARIFSVIDMNTQTSLLAAAISNALSAQDLLTFSEGQKWIEATKVAARVAGEQGTNPVWPEPSESVKELAKRF